MKENAWLLCGMQIDDYIHEEITDSHFRRPFLAKVPDILQYAYYEEPETGIRVFLNNIGIAVALIPLGSYASCEDFKTDCRVIEQSERYQAQYTTLLTYINTHFPGKAHRDFKWVRPVMDGAQALHEDYCIIDGICEETPHFVAMIDCAMIETANYYISKFIYRLSAERSLTRYQRWQMTYYQVSVHMIQNPHAFIKDTEENRLYFDLYSHWGLHDKIADVVDNLARVISMFTLISNSEKQDHSELFSSFMTFFGLVLSFEAAYHLILILLPSAESWLRYPLSVVTILSIGVYGVIFLRQLLRRHRENREFKEKTGRR